VVSGHALVHIVGQVYISPTAVFINKKRDNAKRWTVAWRKSGTLIENVAVINSESFVLTLQMTDMFNPLEPSGYYTYHPL
jgi:hypothetical protein